MFSACPLDTTNTVVFLEALKGHPADVVTFSMTDCTISGPVADTICSVIETARCFQTLANLMLTGITGVTALETCIKRFAASPFLAERTLNVLNFSDCRLQADSVLPVFLTADTSLASIVLSGNEFLSPVNIPDFRQLAELTLSSCSFTGASLLSLFRSLAAAARSPPRLNLDSLRLEPAEWQLFYDGLGQPRIRSLEVLSWSNNTMNAEQLAVFARFVLANPLTELGLSNSISSSISDLSDLVAIARECPIKCLDVGCSRPGEGLGSRLHGVLCALLARGTVATLDVSGHAIGDTGLELLARLAESSLRELRFDRSRPSCYEVLCGVAQRMVASPVTSVEWPDDDARQVLQLVQSSMRPWLSRRLDTARKGFEAMNKKDPEEPVEVVPVDEHTKQRGLSLINRNAKSALVLRITAQSQPVDKSILAFREAVVCQALTEVLGKADFEDALYQAMVQMDDETSVARFLAEP